MAKALKKEFLVIPADAYRKLSDVHSTADDAIEAAEGRVATDEQAMYVVQLVSVSTRREPPISTRKAR